MWQGWQCVPVFAAHSNGMTFYGALCSHASETAGDLVAGISRDRTTTIEYATAVCRAQPGIEFEVVSRASAQDSWLAATGESLRQVIDRRWT
jgi:hypothetical protein